MKISTSFIIVTLKKPLFTESALLTLELTGFINFRIPPNFLKIAVISHLLAAFSYLVVVVR